MIGLLYFIFILFSWAAFPLSPPAEAVVQTRLVQRLSEKGDFQDRVFRRIGNRTVEFEGFISTEADFSLVKEIFNDIPHYPRWILPHINQRPSGDSYFIKLNDLVSGPNSSTSLIATLGFELPLFKREIPCHLNFKTENRGNSFWLTINADPNIKSKYIESFSSIIQVFQKGEGHVWIYAIGNVQFRNWLLYEALPDRMLTRETGERLQIVIDNYLAEENFRRLEKKKLLKQISVKQKRK